MKTIYVKSIEDINALTREDVLNSHVDIIPTGAADIVNVQTTSEKNDELFLQSLQELLTALHVRLQELMPEMHELVNEAYDSIELNGKMHDSTVEKILSLPENQKKFVWQLSTYSHSGPKNRMHLLAKFVGQMSQAMFANENNDKK